MFEKTWDTFKRSPRCNECSGLKRKSIEEIREKSLDTGYVCLSERYINAHTKLQWMCPKGHEFEMIWNAFQRGERCPICGRDSFKEKVSGPKHHNWKGGVTKKNKPLYETYAPQLEWCEEVRCNKSGFMEIGCANCG